MSDAPIPLREGAARARIARARRLVALAESDVRDMAESLAGLREYARLEGISPADAEAAAAFADRTEREGAEFLAAMTERLQAAEAELARLTGPDGAQP